VIIKTQIDANFFYGVKDANGHVDFASHGNQNWYDTCNRTVTFVEQVNIYNSEKIAIEWEIHGLNTYSYDSMFTYTFPEPRGDDPVDYLVRLTAYAENGCAYEFSQWITIYPSPRVKIAGPTQLCEGNTDYLIATPRRSKFLSHTWSGIKGDGTPVNHTGDTLTINGPGVYYLMSLDANGCYALDTHNVTSLKPSIAGLTIRHNNCWGDEQGVFSYSSLSGGYPPYQYAEWIVWRNGKLDTVNILANADGSQLFLGLPAGVYTFYAKDALDCDVRDTICILQPDLLSISAAVIVKTNCAKDNGKITFQIIGGMPPYNISLSGTVDRLPSNATTIIDLPTGIYTAKIVDANGCEKEIEVEVGALPQYTITGKITYNGNPLSGVSIVTNNSIHICNVAVTDTLGEYSLIVDSATKIVLTPALEKYVFTPAIYANEVTENLFGIDFIAASTVGISKITNNNSSIIIYPNPTNGQLIIENGQLTVENIEIYNVVGQKQKIIVNYPLSVVHSIDVSHLANGMYFLKIAGKTVKFIKTNY